LKQKLEESLEENELMKKNYEEQKFMLKTDIENMREQIEVLKISQDKS